MPVAMIGEVVRETGSTIELLDRGQEVVTGLGRLVIPGPDSTHYTDDRTAYQRMVDE